MAACGKPVITADHSKWLLQNYNSWPIILVAQIVQVSIMLKLLLQVDMFWVRYLITLSRIVISCASKTLSAVSSVNLV